MIYCLQLSSQDDVNACSITAACALTDECHASCACDRAFEEGPACACLMRMPFRRVLMMLAFQSAGALARQRRLEPSGEGQVCQAVGQAAVCAGGAKGS